jgi:hypothetical protein
MGVLGTSHALGDSLLTRGAVRAKRCGRVPAVQAEIAVGGSIDETDMSAEVMWLAAANYGQSALHDA